MNTIKFEFLWEIGRENTMTELLRTPLFDVYKEHGGKTIDFGGWELPVQFSSI
ncbi:MAG: glycine cleavage system protein, partial [Bacillales bacterium]|nr:glycine cleavage system protein [Bacillales bacterium]